MTDEEVNRRVAEIEGWSTKRTPAGRFEWIDADGCNWGLNTPRYATDWAWCGPLVEKYGLEVGTPEPDWWWADRRGTVDDPTYADTPQRAICLAVIDAHEGKTEKALDELVRDAQENDMGY